MLTIVDEPVIDIRHIVDWFVEMREHYGLTKIVADTFRLDLVRTTLEAGGFELNFIRNPRAIHSLLAPKVEIMFAKHKVIFGDNPLRRWYTNNVYVKTKKDGNKEYLKKDEPFTISFSLIYLHEYGRVELRMSSNDHPPTVLSLL